MLTSCQPAGCSIKQPLFILIMKSAAVASLWLLVKRPFSSDNLSLLTFFWPAVESSDQPGPDNEDAVQPGPASEDADQPGPDHEDAVQPGPAQEDADQPDPDHEDADQPGPAYEDAVQPGPDYEDADQPGPDHEDADQPGPAHKDAVQSTPASLEKTKTTAITSVLNSATELAVKTAGGGGGFLKLLFFKLRIKWCQLIPYVPLLLKKLF